MTSPTPHPAAESASRTLQYCACILLSFSIVVGVAAPEVVLLILFPAAVLFALAGVLVRLFGVVQLFLSELLLLTLVVGAPCAAAIAGIMSLRAGSREQNALLILLAVGLHTVLHGITSGLWIAKVIGTMDLWERAGLMFLFTLWPPLIVLTILCALGGIAAPAFWLVGLVTGLLAWAVHGRCAHYRTLAAHLLAAAQRRAPVPTDKPW